MNLKFLLEMDPNAVDETLTHIFLKYDYDEHGYLTKNDLLLLFTYENMPRTVAAKILNKRRLIYLEEFRRKMKKEIKAMKVTEINSLKFFI